MTDNTKYFAYYIPENKPVLMQDVRSSLIRTYGLETGKKLANQVEANLYTNDWENVVGEQLNQSLNSLVLVKITDVCDLFIKSSTQSAEETQFINVATSSVNFKSKINNGDNSFYKARNPTFSGTQDLNYAQQIQCDNSNSNIQNKECIGSIVLPELNYIFVETICISLKAIFSFFIFFAKLIYFF